MRIVPQFGCDTGMYLVDVFLDTPEECGLDEDALWRAVVPLLEADGIDPQNVVDLFTRIQNGQGEWVAAIRNTEGMLVPVSS